MRRVATFAFAAMAGTAALNAQMLSEPAVATSSRPSLISNVSLANNDSELVRAAKTAVAARMRDASRSTGVLINDAYIRTHQAGRMSESSSPLRPLPEVATQTSATVVNPPQAQDNRAAVAQKRQALRQEQARAASEMDEPYGGNNMEEDRANQRMTQIPREMQQNEQQVNPPE